MCPAATKYRAGDSRARHPRGTVEKVEDINEILGFGVMMTPALVVDGQVKSVGTVPSPAAIKQMLQQDSVH